MLHASSVNGSVLWSSVDQPGAFHHPPRENASVTRVSPAPDSLRAFFPQGDNGSIQCYGVPAFMCNTGAKIRKVLTLLT